MKKSGSPKVVKPARRHNVLQSRNSATKAFGWLLAPFVLAVVPSSLCQSVSQPLAGDKIVSSPIVSYAAGQLRINVSNTTLPDVLEKIAGVTGVKIDIPEGVNPERIPAADLGPGSPRQILVSLLSDSEFDYLIQTSEKDPEQIQSVVLMPRGKKDSTITAPGVALAARGPRNPRAAAATPVPPAEPPAATPEPSGDTSGQLSAQSTQPPAAAQPDEPPPPASPVDSSAQPTLAVADQTNQIQGQPLKTNVPPTFPVPPPAVLNEQSINQQLQQMYQQRVQMVQQTGPAASLNPGAK